MLQTIAPQDTAEQARQRTRDKESPPLSLGPRRMHYQYSVALPQMHLTFVSFVQGVALAVLLQSIPLPTGASLWSVEVFATAHYAYLPYLISCLLIVLIWKQFVNASVFHIWPLSALQLGLTMLTSVVEIVAFREANHFRAWLVCLGVLAVMGAVMRLNNLRVLSSAHFEEPKSMRDASRIEARSTLGYAALGSTIIAAVIVSLYLPGITTHARVIHWLALNSLLLLMLLLLWLDQRHTKRLVGDALMGSDLEATKVGGLRYRSEDQRKPDGDDAG